MTGWEGDTFCLENLKASSNSDSQRGLEPITSLLVSPHPCIFLGYTLWHPDRPLASWGVSAQPCASTACHKLPSDVCSTSKSLALLTQLVGPTIPSIQSPGLSGYRNPGRKAPFMGRKLDRHLHLKAKTTPFLERYLVQATDRKGFPVRPHEEKANPKHNFTAASSANPQLGPPCPLPTLNSLYTRLSVYMSASTVAAI